VRYFFEIAYLGKNYAGWQSQANATGVQAIVEHALVTLLREPLKIIGSGRTDAGVHCEQQFFHADIEREFDQQHLLVKLNSFLPPDIAIRSIRKVRDEGHARYSAIQRTYQYRITLKKDPFLSGQALHYLKPLNVSTMNEASALLVGVHDFKSFSKVKTDVNNFVCHVNSARWKKRKHGLIFTISANRFLRGMVRAIVGTLLEVGEGKLLVQKFKEIINNKDRRDAGPNVAPHGLFLVEVKYPANIFVKSSRDNGKRKSK
jgi:tRNA pseudouridine38-40 synthase